MEKLNFKITKRKLTFHEALSFIDDIIDAHFDIDEEGTEIYTPYIGKLGTITAFLKYYTDYEFADDNIEKDYSTIGFLKLEDIRGLVDMFQLDSLIESAKLEVEHRKTLIENRKNDELSNLFRVLSDKINSFSLPNIDEERLDKFLKSIENGEFNVDSIVNAYIKSDFHDKKTQELLDEKNEKIIKLENQINSNK